MNLEPIHVFYLNLIEKKNCIWCSKKFEDGLVKKMPYINKRRSAFEFFTAEFLAHAETTHGYDPETIDSFIETI